MTTHYYNPAKSSAAWNACGEFTLFMFLVIVLMAGAFGVLVILDYMSHSPAYVVAALIVYVFVAGMAMIVAINRG